MTRIAPSLRTIGITLLLSVAINGVAQKDSCRNELTIGLTNLTHGEVRGGGLPQPVGSTESVDDKAQFIMGRTRLSFNFQRPGVEARFVEQNLAVWGARGNTDITLYEAWFRLQSRNGLFAQAGRIPLSYDDERIIGPNDWAMAANSHDVLRVGYDGKHHHFHALMAYNQNNENLNTGTYYADGAMPYKTMQTLWYHIDVPKTPLGASLLFMNIGMQAGTKDNDPHNEYQQVAGTFIKYQPRGWSLEASYYRQMGHTEHHGKIEAWMASGKATLQPADNYGFELGFDYLSGDDYVPVTKPGTIGLPHHEVYKGFHSVYGSRHAFYGVMDYFYESAYTLGFTPGLQNAFVGVRYKPVAPLSLRAAYHYMAVATSLEDLGMTLGHDIELEASYRFSKDISLTAGFSYMKGTDTMDELKKGTGNQNVSWGWFSLMISPSIFKTKW